MTIKEIFDKEKCCNLCLGLPLNDFFQKDVSEQIKNYIEELTGEKVIVKKVNKTKYTIQPINDIERFDLDMKVN